MFFGKESSENFTIGQLECESCLYKVGQYIAMPWYVNSELSWISIPFGSAYTNTDKVKQKKISLFVWLLCFMWSVLAHAVTHSKIQLGEWPIWTRITFFNIILNVSESRAATFTFDSRVYLWMYRHTASTLLPVENSIHGISYSFVFQLGFHFVFIVLWSFVIVIIIFFIIVGVGVVVVFFDFFLKSVKKYNSKETINHH